MTVRIADLEFTPPACSYCGETTYANPEGGFDCNDCSLTWPKDGRDGERSNLGAALCEAQRHPYAYPQSRYEILRPQRYRCVRDLGHPLPHRGSRVDRPDCVDEVHEWFDSDEVVAVSL
jgi:hypothetical protein